MKKIFFLAIVTILTGCVPPSPPPPSAIDYYDHCSNQTSYKNGVTKPISFVDMVACGKENRNAACEARNMCSAAGNAIVAYADSLAESVNAHEMKESEARRKWIEFRMTQVNAANQQALQRAAIGAAIMSSPSTCYTNYGVTHCY